MIYFTFGEILGFLVLFLSLPELKNASLMQSRNINILGLIKNFLFFKHGIFTFIDCIPILIITISIFYIIYKKRLITNLYLKKLIKFRKKLNYKILLKIFAYLLFIISSIGYAILQVGFSYHYTSYVFILLISILISISYYPDLINKVLICSSILMMVLYSFFWGGIASKISIYFPAVNKLGSKNIITFKKEKKVFSEINSIVGDSSILFLTDGVANFYLSKYKSPCYEFYPLSIQRLVNRSEKVKGKTNYYKMLKCIKNYDGEFILIQNSWLPKEKYQHVYPNLTQYQYHNSFDTRQRKYLLYKKI
tara:strand:- start:92 stop:1012 length:921 start_codon:yes stop_codon:yes gene_type:complete